MESPLSVSITLTLSFGERPNALTIALGMEMNLDLYCEFRLAFRADE
jgi:hypothetical protein